MMMVMMTMMMMMTTMMMMMTLKRRQWRWCGSDADDDEWRTSQYLCRHFPSFDKLVESLFDFSDPRVPKVRADKRRITEVDVNAGHFTASRMATIFRTYVGQVGSHPDRIYAQNFETVGTHTLARMPIAGFPRVCVRARVCVCCARARVCVWVRADP
jgi:hypothetical protein